ncbi:MAG: hypothetical protein ACXWWU_01465 [Candidatus Limnocylindria bacterium]
MASVVLGILLSLWLAAPASADPPELQLEIDEVGAVSRDGLATVSGRAACPWDGVVTADVRVTQVTAGDLVIEGYATIGVECGKPWVASGVLSNRVDDHGNSLYEAGPAEVFVAAFGCFVGSCVEATARRAVTLSADASEGTGWTYVGSGPLAASTRLTAAVRYPEGTEPGDLLFMSCQGKRNSMRWSVPGFAWTVDYDDWIGPAGLRHAILYRWADGTEGSAVDVRSTTGVNGWSCVMSAFRGGMRPGTGTFPHEWALHGSPAHLMTVPAGWIGAGYLEVAWFVSADDNNHGQQSHGDLAFGGSAYDTTIGTDHAVSMAYHVTDPAIGNLTMRQLARGPDWYYVHVIALLPVP